MDGEKLETTKQTRLEQILLQSKGNAPQCPLKIMVPRACQASQEMTTGKNMGIKKESGPIIFSCETFLPQERVSVLETGSKSA